jgi:hypothetical protein
VGLRTFQRVGGSQALGTDEVVVQPAERSRRELT